MVSSRRPFHRPWRNSSQIPCRRSHPMSQIATTMPSTGETLVAKTTRLMSLDALRGFDMFWIVGAEELVAGLRKVSDSRVVQGLADQLEHVQWEGFHFEDLI